MLLTVWKERARSIKLHRNACGNGRPVSSRSDAATQGAHQELRLACYMNGTRTGLYRAIKCDYQNTTVRCDKVRNLYNTNTSTSVYVIRTIFHIAATCFGETVIKFLVKMVKNLTYLSCN